MERCPNPATAGQKCAADTCAPPLLRSTTHPPVSTVHTPRTTFDNDNDAHGDAENLRGFKYGNGELTCVCVCQGRGASPQDRVTSAANAATLQPPSGVRNTYLQLAGSHPRGLLCVVTYVCKKKKRKEVIITDRNETQLLVITF